MASFDVAPLSVLPIPLALPKRVSVPRLATKCRSVGLRFLNSTKAGWEKQELASWLTGSYRPITRLGHEPGPASERHVVAIDPYFAPAPISTRGPAAPVRHLPISGDRIRAVVVDARRTILRTLAELAELAETGTSTDAAFDALNKGLVSRCLDQDGEPGWLPADLPRLGLADRVLSLFIADYLVRPEDYEREFFQCSVCGDVDFDEEAKEMGACFGHLVGRESGVITKDQLDDIRLVAAVAAGAAAND